MLKHHAVIEQLDGNNSLNSTVFEQIEPESNSEDEPETFQMKFNGCKKYATDKIHKSYFSVKLPKVPPKQVKHEHPGIGSFVKTHPFGHMGHIKKDVKSHEYTFTRFDNHGR